MINTLTFNTTLECWDEQFDWLIELFEEINEQLLEKLDKSTEEIIAQHIPLTDLCNKYHDGKGDAGWHGHVFIYALDAACLVVEKEDDDYTIKKAWYTTDWEDLETFARSFDS